MGPLTRVYTRAVRTRRVEAVFRARAVRFWLASLLVQGLLGATLIQRAIAGESAAMPRVYAFDIPAKPLSEALQAYSRITGVQVMFETASTASYRSPPVTGEFPSDVVLQMLLAGTGLRALNPLSSAIVITSSAITDTDIPPASPLAPNDMALDTLLVVGRTMSRDRDGIDEYIGAVRADLQRALKKAGRAARGDYRVGIKLWVDPSRIVQRAELFGSSGSEARDASIVRAIRGLVLTQPPPANVPQPINFMIAIKTL